MKDVVTGVHMAGGVISRRMVNAIGIGVVKANCPWKSKEYGGYLKLIEGWARTVLKSME